MADTTELDRLIKVFTRTGLSKQQATESARNKSLSPLLEQVILDHNLSSGTTLSNKQAGLLVTAVKEVSLVGAENDNMSPEYRAMLIEDIVQGKIDKADQLSGAHHPSLPFILLN